jgi:hypothetical protein
VQAALPAISAVDWKYRYFKNQTPHDAKAPAIPKIIIAIPKARNLMVTPYVTE